MLLSMPRDATSPPAKANVHVTAWPPAKAARFRATRRLPSDGLSTRSSAGRGREIFRTWNGDFRCRVTGWSAASAVVVIATARDSGSMASAAATPSMLRSDAVVPISQTRGGAAREITRCLGRTGAEARASHSRGLRQSKASGLSVGRAWTLKSPTRRQRTTVVDPCGGGRFASGWTRTVRVATAGQGRSIRSSSAPDEPFDLRGFASDQTPR
jgi:hypothetical protein